MLKTAAITLGIVGVFSNTFCSAIRFSEGDILNGLTFLCMAIFCFLYSLFFHKELKK